MHRERGAPISRRRFRTYSRELARSEVRFAKKARGGVCARITVERERGISVSSVVMNFEHKELAFNLPDTTNHRSFRHAIID